jgi:hypothetical protein
MVALFCMLGALVAPGPVLASDGQVKLALRPIGQAGSFFDLTMRPGESLSLEVEIANTGDAELAARTYASDVYTIINGGFGGRLRDEAQSGMTEWLDYATDVLQLPAGGAVRRRFALAVPVNAGPGEYITSLVLENDQPIQGGGGVALKQVVRQAVGVVVTVPGQRSPGLAIGEASHKIVAGKSIVSVAVQNTGNVRLKPLVGFTLLDAAGLQVSHASVQMDTFYAHTDTFIEVPLAALLLPGMYTVQLTLDDSVQSAEAEDGAIVLIIEAPPEPPPGSSAGPGLTGVTQAIGEGQISVPVWGVVLVAGLLLGGFVIALFVVALRRRRRSHAAQ